MDTTNLALTTIRATLTAVQPQLQAAFGNVAVTTKADGSPVTDLDLSVERALRAALTPLDPTVGWYGEETDHRTLAERSWLVDPIDGTDYFVRGIPLCTTMVALYEHGSITLGVIYNFMTGEFFHAVHGQGAYRNGTPIRVRERPFTSSVFLYESRIDSAEDFAFLRELYHAVPTENVVHYYAVGYQMAQIATGIYDGLLCRSPWNDLWDVAAGILLIQEAGGRVANLGTTHYQLANLDFIAATQNLYAGLQACGLV